MFSVKWKPLFLLFSILFSLAHLSDKTYADFRLSPPKAAYTWFSDPRAIRFGKFTVVGYIRNITNRKNHLRTSIEISGYHAGKIQRVILEQNRNIADDHNNPAFVVRRDGRLEVFWTHHPGERVFHRVSLNKGSLKGWGAVHSFKPQKQSRSGFTYVNPFLINGEIKLFYRGKRKYPTVSTSSDGKSFSPGRSVFFYDQQRPYVKYASDGKNVFMAATEGHPSEYINQGKTAIWFADLTDDSLLLDASKNVLGMLPMKVSNLQLVYRGSDSAWVHDIAVDREGHPIIVFATFHSPNEHTYHYAIFDGEKWKVSDIVFAGPHISSEPIAHQGLDIFYSAGININKADPKIVYLSRKIGLHFELEEWKTSDRGDTWTHRAITENSSTDNIRPYYIPQLGKGNGAKVNLLWLKGKYASYRNFKTRLYGKAVKSF